MTTFSRIRAAVQVAVIVGVFGFGAALTLDWQLGTTPVAARHGWAGPEALQHSEDFIASQSSFTPADGVWQADPKANVRLWKNVEQVLGTYPENVPQEVGDCTSWALKHAIEATQASQIVAGTRHTWRPIQPNYSYGIGRKVLGFRIRGDGCTGAAVVEGAKEYGALFEGDGAPPYSGSLARQWGVRPGPPQKWIDVASPYRVKTTAKITSTVNGRDAVCAGYGLVTCSDAGFEGRAVERDGRLVKQRKGQWMHAMCIDGYDGSGSEPYFHVINSWGPNSAERPIDDSHPGGFWITEKDMAYMIRQGDTWAVSDFDGFPVAKFPDLFGSKAKSKSSTPRHDDRAESRVASLARKTTVAQ